MENKTYEIDNDVFSCTWGGGRRILKHQAKQTNRQYRLQKQCLPKRRNTFTNLQI